jgi:hypothetical protein
MRWKEGDRPVSESPWRFSKNVDRAALTEARLQAHYAAQWLARAARAYVVPLPDDRHTNLGWNDAIGGLTTHPLPQGTVLGLSIADLTLIVGEGAGLTASRAIVLPGRRDVDVRQRLGEQLSARGFDAGLLDRPPPYQMPAHPIGGGAPYRAVGLEAALAALVAWYASADQILGETRQGILARGLDAPPLRCWPHHFDLDSLVGFGSGEHASSVGLGFCPGDAYYDQPYFYVSCYPPPDVASLPSLPPVGHWHTHHFTAAVATADRIVAAPDQRAATEAYLRAATDILIPRS